MDAADNSSSQVQKHVLILKIEKVYTLFVMKLSKLFDFSIPKINANYYFDIKLSHNQETAKNETRIRASELM